MSRSLLLLGFVLVGGLACAPVGRPCASAPPAAAASTATVEPVGKASVAPTPPPTPLAVTKIAWPERLWPDQQSGVVDPAPLNEALARVCGAYAFDDVFAHLAAGGPDRMKVEMEVLQAGKPATGGATADEARIVIERVDLLDDSIGGERTIATLRKRAASPTSTCEGWFVESLRMEWRCVRGGLQGKWVRHWCP